MKKIDDLRTKGHVDETQLALLHKIREKGNAGAHERIAMNRNEMVAGIGIVNLLLEKLYNSPKRQEGVVKKANQALQKGDDLLKEQDIRIKDGTGERILCENH